MTTTSRWRALVAAVLAVCAPALLALLLSAPSAVAWSEATAAAVSSWQGGGWRLLRGGLAWLAAPATLAVVVWCFVRLLRAGRGRSAVIATALAVGSFLTSEAFKLEVLPLPGYGAHGDRNISGHVAMVGAALIVVAVTAPAARRAQVVAAGAAVVMLTSLGVVAARWHDGADVVVPLAVATAWAVVARFVLVLRQERGVAHSRRRRAVSGVIASACAAGTWLLVSQQSSILAAWPLPAVFLAACAATIVTALAAVGVAEELDRAGRSA